MATIAISIITSLLFFVGLLGIFVPFVPGIGLVFLGVLLYAIFTQFASITGTALVAFGGITAVAMLADYAGSVMGARLAGGKRYAQWGTIVGALVGVAFLPPLGLFIGAFAGALLGALSEGAQIPQAQRIAFYSVLGVVGGTLVQFLLGVAMIIAFLFLII